MTQFETLKRNIQLLRIEAEKNRPKAELENEYRQWDQLYYKIKMICDHPNYVVQDLVAKAVEKGIDVVQPSFFPTEKNRPGRPKRDRSNDSVISDSEEADRNLTPHQFHV